MQPLTVKAREPAYAPRSAAPRGEPGLAEVVKNTAADVVHLAGAELRLAKLELTEGLRTQVSRVVWLAAGALPLAVAYLLGVAALVALVRRWFGLSGALAAVALSQAVLGGIIIAVASPGPGAKEKKDAAHRQEGTVA
jgi:uncharacterized membrane protein YqjE